MTREEQLIDQCNKLSESGVPFNYELTYGEREWAYFVMGSYEISEYLNMHSDDNWVVTFDDAEELSRVLDSDAKGMGKAVCLSDDSDLQLIMFHLYKEPDEEEE